MKTLCLYKVGIYMIIFDKMSMKKVDLKKKVTLRFFVRCRRTYFLDKKNCGCFFNFLKQSHIKGKYNSPFINK